VLYKEQPSLLIRLFTITNLTRSAAIAEKADHTALSATAMQHADNGYSRWRNFGGSLVHSTFL